MRAPAREADQLNEFRVVFACETDRENGALTEAEACEEFELHVQGRHGHPRGEGRDWRWWQPRAT